MLVLLIAWLIFLCLHFIYQGEGLIFIRLNRFLLLQGGVAFLKDTQGDWSSVRFECSYEIDIAWSITFVDPLILPLARRFVLIDVRLHINRWLSFHNRHLVRLGWSESVGRGWEVGQWIVWRVRVILGMAVASIKLILLYRKDAPFFVDNIPLLLYVNAGASVVALQGWVLV